MAERLCKNGRTRAENVAEAQQLRAEGLLCREVAERMGVPFQTAYLWLTDPDGAKLRARKDSYRGACKSCGGPTDGSNGRDKAPDECESCRRDREHTERHWTPERIIEAIQRYAARYGYPPRGVDWLAGGKTWTAERERRWRSDRWPATTTVRHEFDTFNAAVIAAGFQPFDHDRDHDWGPGRRSARLTA